MMNAHYLFNEKYFEGIGKQAIRHERGSRTEEYVKFWNRILVDMEFTKSEELVPTDGCQSFVLSTAYPGLITGIGYPHALSDSYGDTDADIKTGFSIDYATGLPIISGTTVKGSIRSAFKKPERKYYRNDTKERWNERLKAYEERKRYLREIIKGITGTETEDDTEQLEKELFEDGNDIFLDAYPVEPDEKGRIYGIDFITPHPDPVTDPQPIRILKVRPGVQYLFRFQLYSSGNFTADIKARLYRHILEDFGIGAKTNVGFGLLQTTPTQPISQYHVLRGEDHIEDKCILGLCPVCGGYMVWRDSGARCNNGCDFRLDEYFHVPLSREQISDLLMGWTVCVRNVPKNRGAAEYVNRRIWLDGYTKHGNKKIGIYYYPKFMPH